MAKIIGNTTATPNPRPDWAQTDETKADYIKNKPDIGALQAAINSYKYDLNEDQESYRLIKCENDKLTEAIIPATHH